MNQLDLFRSPRVLSYGGGLDSFALLLHALQRGERPDVVVFVDVGNGTLEADGDVPGEWPGTYQHIREVVVPLCAAQGIEFVWLDSRSYPVRNADSLFTWMYARGQIPVAGPQRWGLACLKVDDLGESLRELAGERLKASPEEFHAMLDEQPYTFVGIWGGDDKLLDDDGNVVGKMELGDSYVDAAGITTQDGRRFG